MGRYQGQEMNYRQKEQQIGRMNGKSRALEGMVTGLVGGDAGKVGWAHIWTVQGPVEGNLFSVL